MVPINKHNVFIQMNPNIIWYFTTVRRWPCLACLSRPTTFYTLPDMLVLSIMIHYLETLAHWQQAMISTTQDALIADQIGNLLLSRDFFFNFSFYCWFWDRILLHSSDWPWTHYKAQLAAFKLSDPPAYASEVQGLEVSTIRPGSNLFSIIFGHSNKDSLDCIPKILLSKWEDKSNFPVSILCFLIF